MEEEWSLNALGNEDKEARKEGANAANCSLLL